MIAAPGRPPSPFPLLALALALVCGSCGPDSAATGGPPGVLNDSFPLEVRGWDGAEFVLEAPPRRILPLNASAVDALLVLVDPERVVALPRIGDEYSTFEEGTATWSALPRFEEISATSLLGFEPDLVIGHEWQGASAVPYLRRSDVPVLILPMPHSFEDVQRELRVLGRVLDADERATELVDDMLRRAEALREDAAGREGLTVLGYSNYGTGGWAAGADTTVDIVIGLAGMRNAAAEAGLENFQEIDYELLLRIDPDLVLVESELQGAPGPTENLLRGEQVLAGLRALHSGGLARLPRRLSSTTSFRMIEAAEELARFADEWSARGR